MRLQDKIAIIIGAGQSPGETMGNGRATVIRFAQEGAAVLCVDRDSASARGNRGPRPARRRHASPSQADVTREADDGRRRSTRRCGAGAASTSCTTMSAVARRAATRRSTEITEEAFDRVTAVNLRGFVMAVKHALPIMRGSARGVILVDLLGRGVSRTTPTSPTRPPRPAMIAFTEQVAIQNAEYGIRSNMHPARADGHADGGRYPRRATPASRGAEVAAERDAQVPLRAQDGHRLGRRQCGAVPGLRRGRTSSPAWRCRWMAARWCRSAEGSKAGRRYPPRTPLLFLGRHPPRGGCRPTKGNAVGCFRRDYTLFHASRIPTPASPCSPPRSCRSAGWSGRPAAACGMSPAAALRSISCHLQAKAVGRWRNMPGGLGRAARYSAPAPARHGRWPAAAPGRRPAPPRPGQRPDQHHRQRQDQQQQQQGRQHQPLPGLTTFCTRSGSTANSASSPAAASSGAQQAAGARIAARSPSPSSAASPAAKARLIAAPAQ